MCSATLRQNHKTCLDTAASPINLFHNNITRISNTWTTLLDFFVKHSVTVYLREEDNGQVERQSKEIKGFLTKRPLTKEDFLVFCFIMEG
jgi:hypothetical protein